MAVGRAVITTAWKGGKDAVVDGETGFLIPIKNKVFLTLFSLYFSQIYCLFFN